MSDTALVISERAAISPYQSRDDVRELGDRLMKMHPAAGEVGEPAMRAAAQLALLLGANPLPGVNELHVWRDNKGRICLSLGINFWRRKAQEWGGVLWQIQPRAMRQQEAAEYGIAKETTAAICKGVRAEDMLRYRQLGFTANEVWDMCGATGLGTSSATEYAKQGRPPIWTALKRAETDLLRRLFPAEFGAVEREMVGNDGPAVTVVTDPNVIDGSVVDEDEPEPHMAYTVADANRDLFGIEPPALQAQPAPAVKPANGNGGGPLADDELVIEETDGRGFLAAAAALLETDTETLKARFKALGYTAIPSKPAKRVAAYRKLRADLGTPQPAMFATTETAAPGSEYNE